MSHQIAISLQRPIRNSDQLSPLAAFRQTGILLIPVLAVLLSLCPARVCAQMATAEISGTVHDQTAALVPSATITATQASTGIVETTTSNEEGLFAFSTLPVGSYVLTVSAPGFEDCRQTGITLTVGERFSVSAGLKVGGTGQVVSVTAASGVHKRSSA